VQLVSVENGGASVVNVSMRKWGVKCDGSSLCIKTKSPPPHTHTCTHTHAHTHTHTHTCTHTHTHNVVTDGAVSVISSLILLLMATLFTVLVLS